MSSHAVDLEKLAGGSASDPGQTGADAGPVAGERAQIEGDPQERLPVEVETGDMTMIDIAGGPAAGGFRHGGYSILSGRIDGRSAVARRMKVLAERIARDAGFDDFAAMPAVRQAVTMAFCRTAAFTDATWSSFLTTGRLPHRFWERVSVLEKLAGRLGMERIPKPVKLPGVAELLAGLNGQEARR